MALLTSKTRVKPKFSVSKRQEEGKKSRQDELDDLMVVGYACKLFRDDAKAKEIDRGTHLIPWMGDGSLMIDRYDGRGHLHSLSEFDHVGWNEDEQLSAEAARIEAICDEERYMALHMDLLEEQNRQEEELKRLNEALASDGGYTSVSFSYAGGTEDYDPMQPTEDEAELAQKKLVSHENQPPPTYKDSDTTAAAELEEPFVAPPELKLPPGMEQPETLKIHLIIEKTAMFVSSQGPQMEIIVKTKQANNPQFNFLSFDHYLNPYYKLLVSAIKSKKYIPLVMREDHDQNGKKKQEEKVSHHNSSSNSIQSDDEDDDLDGSGYLHPSLFAAPRPKPAAVKVQKPPPGPIQADPNIPPHMAHHHQGEMVHMIDPMQGQPQLMGYYDREPVTTTAPYHMPAMMVMPPPPPDHMDPGNPVQLVPPMGLPPPGYMTGPGEPLPAGPVLSHQHPALVPPMHDAGPIPTPLANPNSVLGPPLISQEMPIPHLAADDSAIQAQPPPIVPPPPDIQPVIDKLARYVAKNGESFEASVRAKNDPRFAFLDSWHSYNAYYLTKKHMFIQEFSQEAAGERGGEDKGADGSNGNGGGHEGDVHSAKSKKVPVRFPIKPKKTEERTLERRSALPVESSSDSEPDDNSSSRMNQSTSSGGINMQQQQARSASTNAAWTTTSSNWSNTAVTYGSRREEYEDVYGAEDQERGYGDVYDDEEMMEGREYGKASGANQKQKLEDRLALAARRKLASASQDRNLQVERRKKLALFLSQVKDRPQAAAAAAAAQDGGISDTEREMSYREDRSEPDKTRLMHGKPRSPLEVSRGERTASSPSRREYGCEQRKEYAVEGRAASKRERPASDHGMDIRSSTGSSKRERLPPVPKSYQTAVNRGVLERERWRKKHSRSRSPSPRRGKRKTPPPPLPAAITASLTPSVAAPVMIPGSSAIIGRASSASPVIMEPFEERDSSVSSPGSDSSLRTASQSVSQSVAQETRTESKGGKDDLRAKIRAMIAATMDLRKEEDIG